MAKINYFFERAEFKDPDIKKPYYIYKGYYIKKNDNKYYPIVLHFGKDEIVISFKDTDGKIHPMFSLYVAEGEINQKMLTEKIEDYWKMPIWPTSKEARKEIGLPDIDKSEKNKNNKKPLLSDKTLLSMSYFSSMYEFDAENDKFIKCELFNKKKGRNCKILDNEISFEYKENEKDILKIKDKEIHAYYINFRRILLDFLYEFDYANTFEDENFFKLQPALQNNKLLDALSRKCCYLNELYKQRDWRRSKPKDRLPLTFLKAEKSWLKVCFDEKYSDIFISADSIFNNVEKETELVLFKSRIGNSKLSRTKLFRKEDASIRNQSATFFLRKYSLYNAFKTLLPPVPPAFLFIVPLLFLLIPFGDLALDKCNFPIKGVCSIGIPIFMLAGLGIYYWIFSINLFRLILPRLFLGIMIGWSIFWSTEELWKGALIAHAGEIVIINLVLIVIIFLYISTDIKNKLIRISESAVLRRAFSLLLFAMLISFIQGFYVVQFGAKTMLENSGFLENLPTCKINNKSDNKSLYGIERYLGENSSEEKPNYANYDRYFIKKPEIKNYEWVNLNLFNSNGYKIRYIWSILLSQFIMSIFIGIILQFLWEDRPITEPL